MGACTICGQPAGWFKSLHEECKSRRDEGQTALVSVASDFLVGTIDVNVAKAKFSEIAKASFLSAEDVRGLTITAWEESASKFLEDGLLTSEEETNLVRYMRDLTINAADVDVHGAYSRIAMAAVLRDITEGRIPDRQKIDVPLPFNFQKDERRVWV